MPLTKPKEMETIIILLLTFTLIKVANIHDKTDKQKHEDYKKELVKLYNLKKLKLCKKN
tara:strand:+ start:752 stop:928 length:177 start_codon:yes stop_codon:yes gene_type:complete